MKQKYAIIVAGGSGTRMGSGIPKQFRNLQGRPMLWWSMKAFNEEDPVTIIILVLPKEFVSIWKDFCSTLPEGDKIPYQYTTGGETRTESVRNGLGLITESDSLIAIHDGARPLLSKELIKKGWECAIKEKAAIPVIPISDSLREVNDKGNHAVNRSKFRAVQTPQIFQGDLLIEAYKRVENGNYTDDASVVEALGHTIGLYEGDPSNIKVTTPVDFILASLLMEKKCLTFRQPT